MGESEDITWITVNGTHIPIKEGEGSREEQVKAFFDKKTLEKEPSDVETVKEQMEIKKGNGLKNKIEKAISENSYGYYGIRVEKKSRGVGEVIIETSKHNPNRKDERDFPIYGSKEYGKLPERGGVSSWRINEEDIPKSLNSLNMNEINRVGFKDENVYLIGSDKTGSAGAEDLDQNEIILNQPHIIAILRKAI